MFLINFFIFGFGLLVGSFLNAVIYRLALAEGLVQKTHDREFSVSSSPFRGRSFCPRCGHQLSWQDLIPLVSFVLLRGRCRYCAEPISIQYPLVELGTGILFVFVFWHLALGFDLAFGIWHLAFLEIVYLWAIASLLVVLFVYDLKHYILPDKILLPAIGVVVLYQIVNFVISHWDLIRNLKFEIRNFETLANPLLAGILAAAFFLAIFLLSRGKAMGFGDVKLALFMGLFLGWPNIAPALFFAFMAGAVVGLALLLLKKKGMKSEIPFGPFLIAGTFAALF